MSPYAKTDASVQSLNPYKVWHSGPIFSQVATTTGPVRIVATAGQVGVDERGVFIKDPEAQIEQAFTNLRRCLEAAGATVKDVFKLVWYIVDYDPKNRLYRKSLVRFLNGHRPATTAMGVAALAEPEYVFEIEAYAAVKQFAPQTVDVVVVGAGLSGLKAAYDVQKAGHTCLVVEARDRVGGKTWSVTPTGQDQAVDVGAAWLNDTNQSHIYALVRLLGLPTVQQYVSGSVVQEDIGGEITSYPYASTPKALSEPNGVADLLKIRQLAESVCQTIDIRDPVGTGRELDNVTLEQWVMEQNLGETAMASVRVWTRAMLGVEPSDMSALYFLDYCKSGGGLLQMRSDTRNGGQHSKIAGGTQSISEGLASLLRPGSVILNSPVRRIEQSHVGVLISSGRGDIFCKRVIVSVPSPLYKEIDFSPPLSKAKEQLGRSNKLGYQLKVILVYREPWWRAHGLCGLLQSFKGPVCVTRDSSVEEKQNYSLTCFVSGDKGIELSYGSQEARFQAVLQQIQRAFGPFVKGLVPQPLAITEHEWAKDQWAQGCPCPVASPGTMTNFGHALREAHYKVHFVGTETAYEWKGYMDGAVRSGVRGAKEVIHVLGQSKL